MKLRKRDYHKYIDEYMDNIRSGKIPASIEILKAMDYIETKLNGEREIFIDTEKIDKAVELTQRYFDIELIDWELFTFALIHCYYPDNDTVVFDTFLIEMGRGNGKNSFISPMIFYLVTHYHNIQGYNIDIVANNEDQAKTSFEDVYNVLTQYWSKLRKFFYKSMEKIVNLRTNSYIKYNTSNAKTKDGKRSACLIFDEIHEYGNWDTIRTFQSGFGKRKHSRTFYITTNGYVRGGVLDELTELSQRVLNGEVNDIGFLPLIYKIDKKEEYLDEKMWVKACPSYPYLPTLQKEMKNEFVLMKYQQHVAMDFFTKRMNFCCEDAYTVVATWEQILATNQPIPYEKIEGMQCIGAVDYAQINDFASVGLLFKISGKYILLEHTFVCHKALEIESRKINFPVLEMVERGLITIVKDDVIKGETIADWFLKNSSKYNIIDIFADDFRKSVLDSAFAECGLPLHSVRSGPITHAKIAPLIETIFSQNDLVVGDNPTFRWYVNNTFQEIDGKGNTTYKKIEPKLRKTDGFFMFIHALTKEDKLPNEEANYRSLDVQIY